MQHKTVTAWLSLLEKEHPATINMGLDRVQKVARTMNLQLTCKVITVAGTNGKGSICAMLESIFHAAKYRVACYTSPHFLNFNERARVGTKNASDQLLLPHFAIVEKARLSLSNITLTYFEYTTLVILSLFAQLELDVAILEVGMGGRLDAVNIIDADCAIISSIDLDHTEYLGDCREAIGFEKAAIMRNARPAICADPTPPQSILDAAKNIGSNLLLSGRDFYFKGDQRQWTWASENQKFSGLAYPSLRGANQLLNAAAVIAAISTLHTDLPVAAQDIRIGLATIKLAGRFQVLAGKPNVVLDVAHNPHAASVLSKNLDNMGFYPYTWAIFGAMSDKNLVGILRNFTKQVDYWCLSELPTTRAANLDLLNNTLIEAGCVNNIYNDKSSNNNRHKLTLWKNPKAAYRYALDNADKNDRIVVFGSFYVVADILSVTG